jgi:uroporphyrinogen-III synthase
MRIFISREIQPDDPLVRALESRGHEVRGWSFVTFEAVHFPEIPEADWLFFYSKNAVKFFFQNLENPKISKETNPFSLEKYQFASMGEGTSLALEAKLKRVPDFVGDGDPVSTASQFLGLARDKKVVFPKARNSRESIARLLGNAIFGLDLVVYDNRPLEKFSALDDAILAFTSPLNAETYFKKHKLRAHQKIVAIGKSTAESLEKMGIFRFKIADEPTETGLVDAIFLSLKK